MPDHDIGNKYNKIRTPEERSAIAKKANLASQIAKRKHKEEKLMRKSIVDTLKDVLYSDITNRELIMSLQRNGIDGERNYLVAMISSAVLRSVKKGCLTDVMKLIETLEGNAPEKLEITNMDKTVAELQDYISKKRNSEDTTDDNKE